MRRRFAALAALVGLVGGVGAMTALAPVAEAASGTVANANVTVSPVDNVPPGVFPVTVAVDETSPDLFEIKAHVCQGGQSIDNTFEFAFDGPYCSPSPLAPGASSEVTQAIDPAATSASMTFNLSRGTGAPWTDFLGGNHQLTCDATHACDLVVQIQTSQGSGTAFFSAPITFTDDPVIYVVDAPGVTEPPYTPSAKADFIVRLSEPAATSVSVKFATAPGTAVVADDYVTKTGTVSFTPGQTEKHVLVSLNDDPAIEGLEQFALNLHTSVGAPIFDGAGVGTILGDPPDPTANISNATVAEPPYGGDIVKASFTVTLSAPSPVTVRVPVHTVDGTAIAGVDYTAKTATVSFTPGTTSKTVLVAIKALADVEPLETFTLEAFGTPTRATIGDGVGLGTILADPPDPTISVSDASAPEPPAGQTSFAEFTVSLSAPALFPVKVKASTVAGTATSPADYAALSNLLVSFQPGQTSKVVKVKLVRDAVIDPGEQFTLVLSAPVRGTIGDGTGVGTITGP